MTTAYNVEILKRAKTIRSPLVTELCTYIDELVAREVELNATIKELRDANALLTDANSDLAKENRGLRAEVATAVQDAKDARHDADCCLRELNRRDEDVTSS